VLASLADIAAHTLFTQVLLCCLSHILHQHLSVARYKVSSVTATLCSQALLVQSAMTAMTQQTLAASDSETQSSGRVTGEQVDGSEFRAEYEARLAVAAEQAKQVGSTAFGTNSNSGHEDSLLT